MNIVNNSIASKCWYWVGDPLLKMKHIQMNYKIAWLGIWFGHIKTSLSPLLIERLKGTTARRITEYGKSFHEAYPIQSLIGNPVKIRNGPAAVTGDERRIQATDSQPELGRRGD